MTTQRHLIICAALPIELNALCVCLGIKRLTARHPVRDAEVEGVSIRLLCSGVGRKRMSERLRFLEVESSAVWLSVGFAGALKPDYTKGQIITGHSIIQTENAIDKSTSIQSLQGEAQLYCSNKMLLSSKEKAEAYLQTGADAVDMESSAVAQMASTRQEPFGFIRVVSDSADEILPAQVEHCIGADGFPSVILSLKVVAKNPRIISTLMDLGRAGDLFSTKLALEVMAFIQRFSADSTIANPQSLCGTV